MSQSSDDSSPVQNPNLLNDNQSEDSDRNYDVSNHIEEEKQEQKIQKVVVPSTYKIQDQRACVRCNLVKSAIQFKESGCDNCAVLLKRTLKEDYKIQINKLYVKRFESVMCILQPQSSWIAKRILAVEKNIVSGAYALKVDMDQSLQMDFENYRIAWVKEWKF